jgi:hypothetical protein
MKFQLLLKEIGQLEAEQFNIYLAAEYFIYKVRDRSL